MFNLLKKALNIIPKQQVSYRNFVSRTPNALGNMVNTYTDYKTVEGSIQPAGVTLLYKLGIADTGDLYTVYLRADACGIDKLKSNDQIKDSQGNVYNIIRTDVWFDYPNQDWNKLLVRRIKNYE